ncbi:TIGR04338 family metallohydrolase [Mycobacterium sp. ITM-2016-00316]|uniref:TIGR04338 family metallohydrolase n=1 Tax=Mycobacterium sp. ITM-2016-00316 TaxID=2099695 RepID=UPI000CFA07BE|nr:TIGR04338 family metallohydrolase [Mycobacterium sp. ITM-2016-00316]WNG82285.1 TIGR04338 family metallohydrolase [Mycobacterium sp. ITM-2016-00316]
MRDSQRVKVYAAEEFVRTLFDRVAQHGNGSIDFFGTALTLPPEARFASVESVRRYVDDVLAMPAVRERWPGAGQLAVRARRGQTAAHYESGTIAVPAGDSTWALREMVVLHEIAHHLAGPGAPHGREFVGAMTELAGWVMGPEVQHVLRVIYSKEGVSG